MKIIFSLLALLFSAVIAHAQPVPSYGPGPVPSPWAINGPAISYGGCIEVPATVTGGCKGNGTLNASAIYVNGASIATGGNVNGPGSSTVGHIATWANTSGSLLQDTAILSAAQIPTTLNTTTLGSGSTVFNSGADANFFIASTTGHFAQSVYGIGGVSQSAIGTAPAETFFVFDNVIGQNIIGCTTAGNCTFGEIGKTLTLNGYTPANASITATMLASGAAVSNIGFTPANIASPTFTGTPAAPTATAGTNTTQLATTAFVTTAVSGAAAVAWPNGTIYGLTLSAASTTTVGIATGGASNEDASGDFNMVLASAFTKSTSSWAVGSTHGGLFNGTIASNTWYDVYLIRKTSDGSIDVGYEVNYPPTHVPSGYAAYRRIGSVLTDGSSHWVPFAQVGNEFMWSVPVVDVNTTNQGTAAVTATLTVPEDVSVLAQVDVGVYYNTSGNAVTAWLSPLSVTDTAPQAGSTATLTGPADISAYLVNSWGWAPKSVMTNTSAQIRTRLSASPVTAQLGVVTLGWIDYRGTN